VTAESSGRKQIILNTELTLIHFPPKITLSKAQKSSFPSPEEIYIPLKNSNSLLKYLKNGFGSEM